MGLKKIKINSIGEEGINNSFGLKSLTEISIGHPLGIDPYYEYQDSPSDANVKGGTFTYKIIGNGIRSYGHELDIEDTPNNLFQNYYDDYFVTASVNPLNNQIATLFTGLRGGNTINVTTASCTDIANSFNQGFYSTPDFDSYVSGNVAGMYNATLRQFRVPKIPNVFFKFTLDLWFTGVNDSATPITESIYATIANDITQLDYYRRVNNNPYSDTRWNTYRGLSKQPIRKMVVSASSGQYQNHQLEFIVTQSYSRVYDAPLGVSYSKTLYAAKSTATKPNSPTNLSFDYVPISFFMNADYEYTNDWSSKLLGGNNPYRSTLKIEPITIIDPQNSVYTQDPPSVGVPGQMSGSFVQPPTSRFQNPNYRGNYDVLDQYRGGDVFQFANNKLMVLYDGLEDWPSAGAPNHIYEQTVTGRLSTFEHTGSKGAWGFGYLGWRYESLTQTSSLVPINNNKDNFNVSEYNPLINSIDALRPSSIYYDLDYSKGMVEPLNRNQIINETAVKAIVVDSHYSSDSWSNLRYKGSRVTSPNINQV